MTRERPAWTECLLTSLRMCNNKSKVNNGLCFSSCWEDRETSYGQLTLQQCEDREARDIATSQ